MESFPHNSGSSDLREGVTRWLEEIAAGYRELRALLEQSFQDLSGTIDQWWKLAAEHETQLRERETAVARQQQQLTESLSRYQALQEDLVRLHAQLDARLAEFDRRLLELQPTEAKHPCELENKDSQSELAALREIVGELRTLATRAEASPTSENAVSSEELAHWQRKAQELEKRVAELEREKEVLETEVHVLRHRAMEWLEMLADQRRQLLDERNRWAAEIRQFRRLVELLIDRQLEPLPEVHEDQEPGGTPRVIPYEPLEARRTGTGDTFLDSLSAQFEQLQREFERRRTKEGL